MTLERQHIDEDFYSGNDKTVRVAVWTDDTKTTPKPNLDNADWIGYSLFDDDHEVYVRKSTSNGASEIAVVDVPNALVEVYLRPMDTWHMQGLFRHQMTIVDENGKEEMVMTGKVQIFPNFSHQPNRVARIGAYISGG